MFLEKRRIGLKIYQEAKNDKIKLYEKIIFFRNSGKIN